jgi:uncharacterized Zn-finger protein
MDIDNILNTKGSAAAAAAAADAQLRLQLEQAAHMNARTNSDMGSDQSSSSGHKQPFHQMSNYPTNMSYTSSAQQQGPQMMSNGFLHGDAHEDSYVQSGDSNSGRPNNDGAPKAFACSTCAKGFARRSDLARHGKGSVAEHCILLLTIEIERIHSGVRPHMCDWPGCGKQFIQRSALTVHARVHTGEKPHMCERCGKVCNSHILQGKKKKGLALTQNP